MYVKDSGYDIVIRKEQIPLLASCLAEFCINQPGPGFDFEALMTNNYLSYLLDKEPATEWYEQAAWPEARVPGKVVIGSVWVFIEVKGDHQVFSFCPTTRNTAQVCLDSLLLREHFIQMIDTLGAGQFILDHGDGYQEVLYEAGEGWAI